MTKSIIAAFIVIASLAMIIPSAILVQQQTQAQTKDLPLQTFQDENHIVITITKNGEPPQGPIVILPPSPGNENGTILTPGENSTAENPGNVTVISPGGNVTEIPGNITAAGNDTVIIAPPDRNITETPGNVTVIDPPRPPVVNETVPAPCTCNQTQPSIPPVIVTPAPGQNVTTGEQPPLPQPPITNNSGSNQTSPIGNETTPSPPTQSQLPPDNQTGNTGGNETQSTNSTITTSTTNSTNSTTTPVSMMAFPGFHITSVNYVGPNSQWLKK